MLSQTLHESPEDDPFVMLRKVMKMKSTPHTKLAYILCWIKYKKNIHI